MKKKTAPKMDADADGKEKPIISRAVIFANIPAMLIDADNSKLTQFLQTKANCNIEKIAVRKYKAATSANKSVANNCYAIVTFASLEDAKIAISNVLIWPNGKSINAKGCKEADDRLASVKPVACRSTRRTLETIPLDCLYHIYRFLAPMDVANLSEASNALDDFAKANNIYKKFTRTGFFFMGTRNSAEFECIVRYFGESFKFFTLDSDCIVGDPVYSLALILRHCPILEGLRVINVKLRQEDVKDLRKEKCASFSDLFVKTCARDIHLRSLLQMWPQITSLSIHCIGSNNYPLQLTGGVRTLQQFSLANATINSTHFGLFLQKHVQSLRSLSLINIKWNSESFYKSLYPMFPQLELLQISITSMYDLMHISGMNLKYLQLVMGSMKMPVIYPLVDFTCLEELDLVQIIGASIYVAAQLPNLRSLSIHDSIITRYDGLIDIIDSLPELRLLRLRRSHFSPEDLLYLIENASAPFEIELELPPMDATIYLLNWLVELSHEEGAFETSVELRIIVCEIDEQLFELTSRLSHVHWIQLNDHEKQRVQRFAQWIVIADGDHHIE